MQYRYNKTRSALIFRACEDSPAVRIILAQRQNWRSALTLVEMIIAMAIMAIIFAVIVPQFRVIQNSWDSTQNSSEILQNGRVLIDHLNRNLSTAVRITTVSDSSETNGYIEFQDNDLDDFRYDVNSTSDYVEFGPIGSLSDLAGPVSQLQFACYDGNDFDTPITDVNFIRFVKVQTTLTNPATMSQDKTFTSYTYLRVSGSGQAEFAKGAPFEFDTLKGKTPALAQIDSTHYLCAYAGDLDHGWAVVLTVDTGTWQITKETPFEFDTVKGKTPALAQIDSTHYLCAYEGQDSDGWARILKVNTSNWTITEEDSFEFDQNTGKTPALAQIDQTHYLCAYAGDGDDGWAVVLSITAPLFDAISMETPFEFDTLKGKTPALAQIDPDNYLCAYAGDGDDGWAVVLTVDTGNWNISKETPFEFDTLKGKTAALAQIDPDNYLCAYAGDGDHGWAVVLTVDTGNWQITKETPFEFDTLKGKTAALAQIDPNNYLCAYAGDGDHGWAVMLIVDTGTWQIANGAPFEFDTLKGKTPALEPIDPNNYLCAYAGDLDHGWSVVLKPALGPGIQP